MKSDDIKWRVIDKPGETFKVHRSIYTDPEIYQTELENIYESNWIYVAHDSQLPNPNDYFTTMVGRQPVIISRDKTGKLHGFINACTHRGAKICRKKKGNAKNWSCPYHGWVFNPEGKILDIKSLDSAEFPDSFNMQDYNLTAIKVDSYAGFIFASLNTDVQSLDDHLAGAKVFMDLFNDQSTEGLEILPGSSMYTHHGNWKMQAENGVDGYHLDIVHASYLQLAALRAKEAAEAPGGTDSIKAIQPTNPDTSGGNYSLGNGHVMIWIDIPNFRDRGLGLQYDDLVSRVGEGKAKWMAGRLRQVMIYPNVILFDGISTQVRHWRPLSHEETEVTVNCIAPVGEPVEARRRRLRQYEDFYGASGLATPDDLTEFDACQEGYNGITSPWQDFDRGMKSHIMGADEEAKHLGLEPDSSAPRAADESIYHGEYRQWLKLMIDGAD